MAAQILAEATSAINKIDKINVAESVDLAPRFGNDHHRIPSGCKIGAHKLTWRAYAYAESPELSHRKRITALASTRVLGANDTIRVGVIGAGGGCGTARCGRQTGPYQIVAVSDVTAPTATPSRKSPTGRATTHLDYHEVLERTSMRYSSRPRITGTCAWR